MFKTKFRIIKNSDNNLFYLQRKIWFRWIYVAEIGPENTLSNGMMIADANYTKVSIKANIYILRNIVECSWLKTQ